ncbi:hypothetical protein [Companilactobacillus insicii]|uniref:hypothetical protein n=1 Tax=Companilactobacillus insicii TaxID=1732567 RepID=UPI000F770E7B|nr:hypothetical protein [Companilactobacillus insicii]
MFKIVDGKLKPYKFKNPLSTLLYFTSIYYLTEAGSNLLNGTYLLVMDYRRMFNLTFGIILFMSAWDYCIQKFVKLEN